jgi:cell division protein FtsQ
LGFNFSFHLLQLEIKTENSLNLLCFVGDNALCEKEVVNKLLIENRDNASTIGKDKVALNTLERRLNSNEMIEKSDVSIDGVLKAVVKQKTPVARGFR